MTKRGRPTKKAQADRRLTNVAMQILQHTSALCELMRDPLACSLEQARDRIQEFNDSWLKTGEGSLLPCSGELADRESCLNDVDVMQCVLNAIDMRLEQVEREDSR